MFATWFLRVGHDRAHLVDSYCGTRLFVISLSSGFEKAVGIELSQSSIASAKRNAQLNSTSSDKTSFLSGGASDTFATVKNFPQNKPSLSSILRAKAAMSYFCSCFWISVVALSCMWAVASIRRFAFGRLYGRRREMGKGGRKLWEVWICLPTPRMSNISLFYGCIRPAGHCGPVHLSYVFLLIFASLPCLTFIFQISMTSNHSFGRMMQRVSTNIAICK